MNKIEFKLNFMSELTKEKTKKIGLDTQKFQPLWEAYYKLGEFLATQNKEKNGGSNNIPKTLYGIWKGVKIDESDFQKAEKSLFKNAL